MKKFNEAFMEVDFATVPYKRCVLELNLVQGFLADTGNAKFTKYPGYFLIYNWLHYYPKPTWKLTAGFYYGRNFEVSEVGQPWMNEYRFLPMAQYNVPSRRLYSYHRIAMDIRWLIYESRSDFKFRTRYRLKLLYPINKMEIVRGTLFAVGMEELFLSKVSGIDVNQYFEQNRITLNLGYCFTDNVQMEIGWTGALQPFKGTGYYYFTNIYFAQMTFNNLLSDFVKDKTKF